MHESNRLAVWLARLAATSLLHGAAMAAQPDIKLTSEQLATAGVRFSRAVTPNPDAGGSVQLAGRIVVPNDGLEQILAPVSGRIESLLVNLGQTVRAGQALVRVHSPEFLTMQRQLIGARARQQAARARLERDAALVAEGIIARSRLEESQAALTEIDAQLGEYRQLLRFAGMSDVAIAALRTASDIRPLLTLSARHEGSVLRQLVAPGDAVEPGAPLLRLARLDVLWVELQATREQALRIRVGDRVSVSGCEQVGSVVASALQLGDESQTLTLRAELQQPGRCVAPGQFVETRLTPSVTAVGLVQVPAASLVQNQGANWVFVREGGRITARQVTVERRSVEAAWITGDVRVGEEVATAGLAAIKGSWLGLGATPSGTP